MPCETSLKPNQTISQRAAEVRRAVSSLDAALQSRRVKVVIGPKGGIAFTGWNENERDGVRDGCAYRRIMATGTALARAEIARAEQLAGRSVDKQAVGQGLHYHEGSGWHDHKG